MRTVRSLLRILAKFPQIVDEVVVIHAPEVGALISRCSTQDRRRSLTLVG